LRHGVVVEVAHANASIAASLPPVFGESTSEAELQVPEVFVNVKETVVAESVNPPLLLRLRLKLPKPSTVPGVLSLKLPPENPVSGFDSDTVPRV
jgi:hypothetical protein